jgi:hypothetical protein
MPSSLSYEQVLVYGNMRGAVFYQTPAWKRARYLALTTYGNRCQLCGTGPSGGPLQVDHILPRSLHPERCLDPTNLQVLCEPCHTAKGLAYFDDCRAKLTKEVRQLRDFFRLERQHLVLEFRPPTSKEAKSFALGVRAASKSHRQRWRLLVNFLAKSKKTYPEAISLTVGDMLHSAWVEHSLYQKFTYHGGGGLKAPDKLFFDIDGCTFPHSLVSLLADDQRHATDANA